MVEKVHSQVSVSWSFYVQSDKGALVVVRSEPVLFDSDFGNRMCIFISCENVVVLVLDRHFISRFNILSFNELCGWLQMKIKRQITLRRISKRMTSQLRRMLRTLSCALTGIGVTLKWRQVTRTGLAACHEEQCCPATFSSFSFFAASPPSSGYAYHHASHLTSNTLTHSQSGASTQTLVTCNPRVTLTFIQLKQRCRISAQRQLTCQSKSRLIVYEGTRTPLCQCVLCQNLSDDGLIAYAYVRLSLCQVLKNSFCLLATGNVMFHVNSQFFFRKLYFICDVLHEKLKLLLVILRYAVSAFVNIYISIYDVECRLQLSSLVSTYFSVYVTEIILASFTLLYQQVGARILIKFYQELCSQLYLIDE